MSPATESFDAEVLGRVILPEEPNLSVAAAQSILALKVSEQDQARMSYLAEQARQGALTQREQQEIDGYVRVGSLLSILQSKARRSLRQHGAEPG
jgi:hypothetical protein